MNMLRTKKSYEFPTEEALKKYLQEHPKADKSLHHVKKHDVSHNPKFTPSKLPRTDIESKKADLMENGSHDKWRSKLTNTEKFLLQEYTGLGYTSVNSMLRDKPDWDMNVRDVEALRDEANTLDNALRKYETPKPVLVHRGQTLTEDLKPLIDKILSGELEAKDVVISDRGFTSTSLDPQISTLFMKGEVGVLFNITLPKGTHGGLLANSDISENADENEFLLASGSSFRLTKVQKKYGGDYNEYFYGNDFYSINCELVSQKK